MYWHGELYPPGRADGWCPFESGARCGEVSRELQGQSEVVERHGVVACQVNGGDLLDGLLMAGQRWLLSARRSSCAHDRILAPSNPLRGAPGSTQSDEPGGRALRSNRAKVVAPFCLRWRRGRLC